MYWACAVVSRYELEALNQGRGSISIAPSAMPNAFSSSANDLRRATHKALSRVGTQIEGLRFNVAVAQLYEFTSALQTALGKPGEDGMAWALREAADELQKRIASVSAGSDRTALGQFYAARQFEPVWHPSAGTTAGAAAIAAEVARAGDYGLRAADFDLPSTRAATSDAQRADAEVKLALAALKYARHARGGRVDPAQLSNYIDRKGELLEPKAVLEGLADAKEPDAYLRGLHPQHPQFEWLRQKYLEARNTPAAAEATAPAGASAGKAKAATPAPTSTARRLLANMEQWRWMPADLGDTYVWVNIPEFTLRVVKDGKVVHTERVITGKADTQTPIFSDQMETVVFHPMWGVPDSIKIKEILPSLARGGSVLAKNNLRLSYKGRDVDPQSVDWAQTDIRQLHVYQPPGGPNVLGVVKFVFPNKHQVYMHDTPTKSLFNATQRTFSHGCMRVRDPVRLAEVILGNDKGWGRERVASLAGATAAQNNHVNLTRKIPVHITYFTAFVDEAGQTQLRPDIYGHEERIHMGIEGKAHLIARKKEDLGPVRAEVLSRLVEARQRPSNQNWIKQILGF